MLAVLLFAAFWAVLGLGVFFLGVRRGPSAGAKGPGYRGRRALGWVLAITYIAFGIALPTVILLGNRNNANAQVGGIKLTAAEKRGRVIFGARCAVCHTLAAANAVGKVGPNLDTIKPSASLVLHTVQNGCLPNAPNGSPEQCLGQGVMPSDVVTGRNARDVAAFVAKVAGNE